MKKNRSWKRVLLATAVGVGMVSQALPLAAKVEGQCAECHTMHNSQGGKAMAIDASGVAQDAPNDVLLIRGCVACHTGVNDGTNNIPFVNATDTADANYGTDGTDGNTLAGGNFYWVATNGLASDPTGHNVGTDELSGVDTLLGSTPPGNGGVALGSQLSCAGAMGCHGDRSAGMTDFQAISGTHHGDDTDIDGSTVAKSFRFLKGVTGFEDPGWEYQPSANAHNQYKGVDRTAETDAGVVGVTKTISALCAECHKDFHNGADSVEGSGGWGSPWVRHPTDFDMGNTADDSEYRGYGGTSNAYRVSAPVASSNVDAVLTTVNFTGDQAIVTCISCHRAHGTPNDDLLRWDYSEVEAGGTIGGACFECHTTKM